MCSWLEDSNCIDQFRYIKIQPIIIDLNTRLQGITTYSVCGVLIHLKWAIVGYSFNLLSKTLFNRISGKMLFCYWLLTSLFM